MTAKEAVRALLNRLPDDCTLDDVLYELHVVQANEGGLADIRAGRTIQHEQVRSELTRAQRVRVAERLLLSLEEPEEEVALAWVAELERRSAELVAQSGESQSSESALAGIRAELRQRRAGPTPRSGN